MTREARRVDLQVNGYAGIDFNQDALDATQLRAACEALHRDRVAQFLPTIVTEEVETMAARLHRLVTARAEDEMAQAMIPGLHIEGPFLNPRAGYRGAHPEEAIRTADREVARRLLEAADGLARIFTLAPEQDPELGVTHWLARQGVAVAAGHCNPDRDRLEAAADAGLSMFTHLGNGCPREMDRHDNVIQRALSLSHKLWLGFIGDGIHVPLFALGNYLRAASPAHCFLVSDAMAAAGLERGRRHRLGRWEIEVDEQGAAWAPDGSHLVGSAISLGQAEEQLQSALGLTHAQADQLTRDLPCRVAGLPR